MIFNEMRSKTKTFDKPLGLNPADYPDWSYDGSSTGQATGKNSDCILRCVAPPCMMGAASCGMPGCLARSSAREQAQPHMHAVYLHTWTCNAMQYGGLPQHAAQPVVPPVSK